MNDEVSRGRVSMINQVPRGVDEVVKSVSVFSRACPPDATDLRIRPLHPNFRFAAPKNFSSIEVLA